VLAPLGWAAGSLWSRRLPLAPGPSGAATQMITGGGLMLALSPLLGERAPSFTGASGVSAGALLALGYLAVFGSLVAFSAYDHALKNARPALAMSYAYVNPVLAVVLGAALGAEAIGPEVIVATLLIVGAVLLLVRGRSSAG
jgi:drug/metabolite transporter (DMT)-like permease